MSFKTTKRKRDATTQRHRNLVHGIPVTRTPCGLSTEFAQSGSARDAGEVKSLHRGLGQRLPRPCQ